MLQVLDETISIKRVPSIISVSLAGTLRACVIALTYALLTFDYFFHQLMTARPISIR